MPSATQAPDVSSQTHHISGLPSELLMVAESQWLFTEAELLFAPSIVGGKLSPEKERENRGKGVNFILQAGIMLKLPQITLATASVFLHRFYMRHSMIEVPGRIPGYHYYSMAATCLFLATKVEENCRKMKELVIACVRVAQKDPNKLVDEQDSEYWRWRDNILHSEDVLLEALCFDLSLEAPYKTLFELLLQLHHENHKRLRNAAWAFVNDSCLTMLCLLFPSRTIAASALYAAAKYTEVTFPDDKSGRPWWESAGVDIVEVRRACNYMADMYENAPAKPGREGMGYERTPEFLDDWDDQTRELGPRAGEGQSQTGSAEEDGHRSLKRNRDDEQEKQHLHTSGASMNGAVAKPNASREESPQKRIKSEDECNHQPPNGDRQGNKSTSPGVPMEAHPLGGTGPALKKSGDDPTASIEETSTGGGLISPKLDEVSEEGEVEP